MEKIRAELVKIPGIGLNLSQPIALRVDQLISGVKSQVAVKIFGDDMAILLDKAEDAGRLLKGIKGVTDLRVEQVAGQPYLNVKIDRRKIARYGINVAEIQEVIETASAARWPLKSSRGSCAWACRSGSRRAAEHPRSHRQHPGGCPRGPPYPPVRTRHH